MSEEFTTVIVCPRCGTEYKGPSSEIPQFCGCGQRFWHPVVPASTEEGR